MNIYIVGRQGVTSEGVFFNITYCTKIYQNAIKALFKADSKNATLHGSEIPLKFHDKKEEYTNIDLHELLSIFKDAQEKIIFFREIEISD